MTVRAMWNGTVVAESDRTVVVEGNHYFPPEDVRAELLQSSPRHTVCPWKGRASYYDVVVDGSRARNAAWYYPSPLPAAAEISGRIAFWKGVKVIRADLVRAGGIAPGGAEASGRGRLAHLLRKMAR